MANLNKVFLIGNLTRDPEIRYTPNGTAVCDLGMAINRRFSSRSGDQREETVFVDVVVWARQAEVVSEYLHKGDPIFIEGRLQLDQWEGRDGQKRSKMRVVAENFQFLSGGGGGGGGRGGRGGRNAAAGGGRPSGEQDRQGPPPDAGGDVDDDIPF